MNTPFTPIEFFNDLVKRGKEYRFGDYAEYLQKEKASKAATDEAQILTQTTQLKLRN